MAMLLFMWIILSLMWIMLIVVDDKKGKWTQQLMQKKIADGNTLEETLEAINAGHDAALRSFDAAIVRGDYTVDRAKKDLNQRIKTDPFARMRLWELEEMDEGQIRTLNRHMQSECITNYGSFINYMDEHQRKRAQARKMRQDLKKKKEIHEMKEKFEAKEREHYRDLDKYLYKSGGKLTKDDCKQMIKILKQCESKNLQKVVIEIIKLNEQHVQVLDGLIEAREESYRKEWMTDFTCLKDEKVGCY